MAGTESLDGHVMIAVVETRLDTVTAGLEQLKPGQQAHHDRVARLEGELERVRDRQPVMTMALAAFNVVVANVAAWLSRRR